MTELTNGDLESLKRSAISETLAHSAGLQRVDSREGAELIGRNGTGGDYAGIAFPYYWPGDSHPRDYRLRRDHPDLEQKADGIKECRKYLSPPGRGNLLYFAPNTLRSWLSNVALPVVITEGEKKTLALHTLAWHGLSDGAEIPQFLPIGLSGVWNWRGTVGKTTGPDGDRRDIKGVISDFDKISWHGRRVVICFDVNIRTNESVQHSERALRAELRRRGAIVETFKWPADTPANVNGIDDLIGVWGPERVCFGPTTAEPSPTTTTSMKFTPLGELLREHEEETAWLLADHLPLGGDSLLVAKPKTGKSTLARCLALAVARGEDFLGCHTAQGSVFYLALEEKRAEVRRHFRAMGARDDDPIFIFCATSPVDGLAQLREAMKDEKPVLVIVDPLFRFVRIKDGNDYAAVTNA